MEKRIAECTRKTKETDITMTLCLDGSVNNQIDTGIPFFDHMLDGFARHGLFDLRVKVKGDLAVDCHHTVEDTGIVLGQAIAKALGEKTGIRRYGYFILPMDETLALCAADLSGRPYFKYDAEFTVPRIGGLDTEMIRDFFLDGGNNHHMAEALFKAFGKALDMASSEEPRIKDVWSTKGTL